MAQPRCAVSRAAVTIRSVLSWLPLFTMTSALFLQATYAWDFNVWCWKFECCQEPWINHKNITDSKRNLNIGLQRTFRNKLYGQHLVTDTVLSALKGHFKSDDPPKPLVLSFHGRTGTGKNYVARLIAESIYKKGMESSYVHIRSAHHDYPHEKFINLYKEQLKTLITGKIGSCPHQVFIFDEVEDMPKGLLDTLKSYLDYNSRIHDAAYRKAIYIFLSNTAAVEITTKTMDHLEGGGKREDIRLKDMEEIIEKIAFNTGGFHQSRLIDSYVVSHFIPFLPLERVHVRSCVRALIPDEPYLAKEALIDKVMEHLQFVPRDMELFALKGCKNVAEKVILVLFKNGRDEL